MYLTNKKLKNYNCLDLFDKTYVVVIFIFANILISPLVITILVKHWLIPVSISISVLFVCISVKKIASITINKIMFFILIFFQFCQCLYGIYYRSIRGATYNSGFLLAIITLLLFNENKHLDIFVNWTTNFIIVLIAGAYIGFFYALMGGTPIVTFLNPDSRTHSLFLTTCTNSVFIGNIIRPSGIYDEPGAFSFFICSICLLRSLVNKNDFVTFLLLLSGLITFSLTHFLIFLCYLIHSAIKYRKKKHFFLLLTLTASSIIVIYVVLNSAIDELLLTRFDSYDDIINNNRTSQLKICLNLLDTKTFFLGQIADYNFDFTKLAKKYGAFAENPLSPMILTGLITTWIYYLCLGSLLLAGILNKKYFFIFLSIIILFMQRPFFASRSYSIYFVLFFYLSLFFVKDEFKKYMHLNAYLKRANNFI
jgi:hypothetical protein